MRFRTLDADDTRSYLNELRPRFLFVRIQAGRVNLRWWVPAWAFEEPIRFLLRLIPIGRYAAPAVTARLLSNARIQAGDVSSFAGGGSSGSPDLWTSIDALFSEADRDLFALPDDVPFVDVRTDDVRVYIGQTRI